MITLYHNPRCSKSRQALALLEEKGQTIEIVRYLETPPDADTLEALLTTLGVSARDLLRKGEAEYKELGLADTELNDRQLVDAMVRHPKLIERPIAIKGNRAVIGRPPEAVLTLL